MKNRLKSVAFGMAVAFGIAGVAQASEQPAQPTERQMPQSMGPSQMTGQPGQGSVMSSPEMRQRMMAMMERCQRMISKMGTEQGDKPAMPDRQ